MLGGVCLNNEPELLRLIVCDEPHRDELYREPISVARNAGVSGASVELCDSPVEQNVDWERGWRAVVVDDERSRYYDISISNSFKIEKFSSTASTA
jgi:ribosome modulation factor